ANHHPVTSMRLYAGTLVARNGALHRIGEKEKTTMRSLAIAVSLALLFAMSAEAQQAPEKLGTVSFPTSCSAAAQKEFTRAVALLHSFWFGQAIKGFEAAAQADPGCGISYWGGAVSRLGNPLA